VLFYTREQAQSIDWELSECKSNGWQTTKGMKGGHYDILSMQNL
jgi:hypothetical protein